MEQYLPAALARNPKLLVAVASFVAGAATTYAAYTWSARAAPTTVPPADGAGSSDGDGDIAPPVAAAVTPPHAPGGEPALLAAATAAAADDIPAAAGGGGLRVKAPLAAALPRPITSWVVTRSAAHGLAADKVVRVALEWARRDGGDAVFSVTPAASAAVDGGDGNGDGGDGGDAGASVSAAAPPPGEVVYSVDEAHLRWLDAVVALGAVGSRGEALHRVLAAAAAADDAAVFGVIRCRTDGCAGATAARGGDDGE